VIELDGATSSGGTRSNNKSRSSNINNSNDNDSDIESVSEVQDGKLASIVKSSVKPAKGGAKTQDSDDVLDVWDNEVAYVHREVVDISGGCEDDSKQSALMKAYEDAVKKELNSTGKSGRNKRARSDVARAAVATEDVVVIDGDDTAGGESGGGRGESKRRKSAGQQTTPVKGVDPETEYRRVLGPLRMKFVESFTTRHSYAQFGSSALHSRFDMNRTYKELMEYQLNLPVQVASSIFVRALEGQINTIRVMITGTNRVLTSSMRLRSDDVARLIMWRIVAYDNFLL
jgi:hypothetical protein